MSNPKRTRKEIREAIKKIKIKRKLNSKNPKYWDKSQLNEKPIKKKVLYTTVKGCKIHGVWYE